MLCLDLLQNRAEEGVNKVLPGAVWRFSRCPHTCGNGGAPPVCGVNRGNVIPVVLYSVAVMMAAIKKMVAVCSGREQGCAAALLRQRPAPFALATAARQRGLSQGAWRLHPQGCGLILQGRGRQSPVFFRADSGGVRRSDRLQDWRQERCFLQRAIRAAQPLKSGVCLSTWWTRC